jgi:hypothetical protein
MQLIQLDLFEDYLPQLCSGKTSQESSGHTTTRSDVSWDSLLEQTLPSRPAQTDGRVQVWLPAPKGKSRGGCSMLNISESLNDVAASMLWQVLERGSIPQRYFLSAAACKGILRRAAARGKTLPIELKAALEAMIERSERSQPILTAA